MVTKHYPYYSGGDFDRIVFDMDESAWVPEAKLRDIESENASLRGAAQGLGKLCDRYKAENAKLRARLGDGCADCAVGMGEYADSLCDPLKAENAKLREVAAILWKCCAWETDSFWCDECDHHDDDNGGCKVEKVLRELGIEAN